MKAFIKFLAALTILALSNGLMAQRADRATLTGVVTDPSGIAIANVTVKVLNVDTGVESSLQTNESGVYSSPSLVLGKYSVSVESPGFKKAVRSGITLIGGQTYRQDMAMELGSIS